MGVSVLSGAGGASTEIKIKIAEKLPDSTRFNAKQEHGGGVAVTKVAYARITHDKKQ